MKHHSLDPVQSVLGKSVGALHVLQQLWENVRMEDLLKGQFLVYLVLCLDGS